MKLSRYPKYKDSGVKWMGELPAHWEVVGLTKYLASLVDYRGRTPTKTQDGVFLVTARNIRNGAIDYEASQEYIEPTEYKEVMRRGLPELGDVLFTTEAPLGQVAIIDRTDIALAQRIIKFRGDPARLDNHFLKYWIMGRACQFNLEQLATGSTALGIKGSKVGQVRLCMPPLDEQARIVSFLDTQALKIDALVAKQRRLIDLLKEKRQAIISHSVTKGLNSSATMKPSGVKWLGNVPTSWKVCLLRRAFRSIDYGISDAVGADGSIAILRMGNIVGGKIDYTDLKYIDAVDRSIVLQKGDLLYNRTNSLDQIGKVGLFHGDVEGQFSFASYLVRLRTASDSLPEFFAYLLNTENILGLARASAFVAIGQCNLNPSRYGGITVAIPPKAEQFEIVRYLDKATAKIDSLIADASSTIDILQERRSALISAAVTGQIDVRNYRPEEAPAVCQ